MPDARSAGPARVLYLHTTSEIGGSDVSLVRLVESLDRRRYQAVVALPADGPLAPRLRAAGAAVLIVPSLWKLTSRKGRGYLAAFALHFPLAVRRLSTLIAKERVAIVHTNTIHNLYGGPAAAAAGVPHVWHIREIVWQSAWLKRLELWMVRRWSTRIIVTSDAVAAMFGPERDRPATLVKVPNGVETDRYRPGDGTRVRMELGVPDDRPLVAIACRLDDWKGVDVFLDAAAAVGRERPDACFAVIGGPIVGQDAYARSLKERPSALELGARVRFTDWRYPPSEMPDVHRAIDVMVVASTKPEPFGLTVIEAMATGKPVIATRAGGPAEIVQDGVTGLLVPPGDAEALGRAMLSLIDDPARARHMGEAGRRRAVELFSADRYVTRIQQVYDDVMRAS
jgi:glycosyltransferase involved in cell wall biosynthesis